MRPSLNHILIVIYKGFFGKKIDVGRYFNVNGAIGAALLAQKSISITGFNFQREVEQMPERRCDYDEDKVSIEEIKGAISKLGYDVLHFTSK